MFPQQPVYPMSWYMVPNMYYPNYHNYGHPMMYQTHQIYPFNGVHYPYRIHQPHANCPVSTNNPSNTTTSHNTTPDTSSPSRVRPTLRRIEIRTENVDGEETNIPLTSSTYDHMNEFISNLVQDVNIHNQMTRSSTSNPESDSERIPDNEPEDQRPENDETVSIMDLQNYTQLETFDDSIHTMTEEECTCSICHNRISNGQIVRVLRCSHTFHNDCVDRWLYSASTCPLCRTRVVPNSEENLV